MTPVCIFTYRGDELPLRECVRSVLAARLCPVVCDDSADPLPEWILGWLDSVGAEYLTTLFPRRGNLNGTDCAAGIARTMAAAAKRYGMPSALKLDADTILIDPTPFLAGNVGACSTTQARRDAFGACYALRRETAENIARELEFQPIDETAPEDLTVWQTARDLGEALTLHDCKPDSGLFAAVPISSSPEDCMRFASLTFGNEPTQGWQNRPLQIAQEMRRFNDRISLG
jgi:hypothetical protein